MVDANTVDKKKLDQTKDLVQLFNKTFNTMRIFTQDHPSWGRFKRDIVKKFDEYLDIYGELLIEVEETRLIMEGAPLLEERAKRHSMTFMLYTDGVRELTFEAGMPPEEILGVIDVFIENSRIPEEERDIVCLLWERNFPNLHYLTVEDLPDAETAALLEKMAKEMPLEELLPTHIALNAKDNERVEKGKKESYRKMSRAAYLANLKAQLEEPEGEMAIAISEQKEEQIVLDLIEKESVFNPNEEMADFLLEVLHKEEEEDKYKHYANIAENFYEKILSYSDFLAASRFIRGLNELADSFRDESSPHALQIDSVLREMSSRNRIEGLERVINEGMPFQPEDFYDYLILLRPNAIDPLCDLLGRIDRPQMKTYIYKALEKMAAGHEQIIGQKLRDVPLDVARGLLNLLGNMGERKVIQYMKPLVSDQKSSLRFDTIQALRKIGGKEANGVFIELMNDQDSDVRAAAARSLDLTCESSGIVLVLEMVSQQQFQARPMLEKKALLECLGSSKHENSLPVLIKLLKKKGFLFRKRFTETRICAIYGLSQLGTEEAYEVLNKQTRNRNQRIRETSLAVLRSAGKLQS